MKTLRQATRDIKEFRVQGANQIALHGLAYLRQVATNDGFGKKFDSASAKIERARPTAVVLHNCIKIIKSQRSVVAIDSLTAFSKQLEGKRQFTLTG